MARVVLADLDGGAAERQAAVLGEGRALGLHVDVVDRAGVEGAVAAAVARIGGLDVVVANAGIEPEVQTVFAPQSERFDRVLAVNLDGVRHTVEAALPQVVARRGHVVVIASIYAFFTGVLAAPYAMSKAAVEAYGRALRVELAPHGATAGVAYFGFIDTALVERSFAQRPVEMLRQTMPAFMTAPQPVGVAGEALVRGIERRSATITAPGWVRPARSVATPRRALAQGSPRARGTTARRGPHARPRVACCDSRRSLNPCPFCSAARGKRRSLRLPGGR